jgi:predicted glutamine amidotransferase
MCVICILQPGFTLPFEMLSKACHNNPHGYGVIIKRKEGLDIRKALPEGGNDPEEIYKILKDNEDAERVLHVRWKTHGDISENNTQPFEVFNQEIVVNKKKVRRQIAFAHNGTLGTYAPSYVHPQVNQNKNTPSDSLKFAQEVLRPFLPRLYGQNGVADIEDPIVQIMLDKYWTTHGNRGILVCNNLESYFFNKNSWEEIETEDGKFLASNNDYFKEVTRGPLYERLEAEKRKKAEEERAAKSAFSSREVTILPSHSPKFYEQYRFSEGFSDILEDFDMYKVEGYLGMANITYHEWFKMIEDKNTKPDDIASLFLYLTDYLKKAHEELDTLKNPKPVDQTLVA